MTTSFPFLISKAEDGSESHDDVSDEVERCPKEQTEHHESKNISWIKINGKTRKSEGHRILINVLRKPLSKHYS